MAHQPQRSATTARPALMRRVLLALLLPSATAERCLAVYCSGWTGGLPGSQLNGRYVPDENCCDELSLSPASPPYYMDPPSSSPPPYIDPSPPSSPFYMDPPSSSPPPYGYSPPSSPMMRRLLWERRLNHDGGEYPYGGGEDDGGSM